MQILPPPLIPVEKYALTNSSLCPCCGKALILGEFSRLAHVSLPSAVRSMRASGQAMETFTDKKLIIASERTFMSVDVSIPLNEPSSPIRATCWVELEERHLSKIVELSSKPIRVPAHLASDIPGFPGTLGAKVYIEQTTCYDGEKGARLISCDDFRMQVLKSPLIHEEYLALYRNLWGEPRPVIKDNSDLRDNIRNYWREIAGRSVYYSSVEPPPYLSGIEPTLIGVCPPCDVWDKAMLVTVGSSEAGHTHHKTEFVCWVYNPSEDFSNTFSEFCYWSRAKEISLKPGQVVSEPRGIPGTKNKIAWLICYPFSDEIPSLEEIKFDDNIIHFLQVIPISKDEHDFASEMGTEALIQKFIDEQTDVFNLFR